MKDVYYLDLAHIVSKEISRTMKINDESEDTIRQQAKIISINRNRNKDNNNDNYSPAA